MKFLYEVCREASRLFACDTGIDWRTAIDSFPKYYIYFMFGFVGNALKCQFSFLHGENSSGTGNVGNETTRGGGGFTKL
jgi:hypothetical protein